MLSETRPQYCQSSKRRHSKAKSNKEIIDVNDSDWPHTDEVTKTVTVHSPFSGMQFGAWTAGATSHRGVIPNWLVLGHELCGHAKLIAQGTHPTGPHPYTWRSPFSRSDCQDPKCDSYGTRHTC
jgi:hypothetical protein